jgi:hypothetical protein
MMSVFAYGAHDGGEPAKPLHPLNSQNIISTTKITQSIMTVSF